MREFHSRSDNKKLYKILSVISIFNLVCVLSSVFICVKDYFANPIYSMRYYLYVLYTMTMFDICLVCIVLVLVHELINKPREQVEQNLNQTNTQTYSQTYY